ncbi:inorganic phosphate transporter [Pseudothermotoga sp.]|uniref:inorganic phosphate transporter n=1 Tax=Pseudothermotoga sp. TaxID=2033661 RepID=UPI0031F60CEC
MWYVFPSVFLGWSLGANDAANVFGPTVASGLIPHRKAMLLGAIFVVLGAVVGGSHCLINVSQISTGIALDSAVAILSAALTVTVMTLLKFPVSTSQAVFGGIVGVNIHRFGFSNVNWAPMAKFVIVWVLTPIGAMIISFLLYKLGSTLFRRIKSIQVQDSFVKLGSWIAGLYGSYALGANNVANVTGALVGSLFGVFEAALLGGICIGLGMITFSKRVIMTVGKSIIALDHFSAMIAIFAHSLTVWVYSLVGIPVSSSQAIVGAVIGAGYAKGVKLSNIKMILNIVLAWVETPFVSATISYLLIRGIEL